MRVVLSRSSGVPIYEQIRIQVRDGIFAGDLEAGELLPSLRQLAADLRVSIITVTRAYNDLVAIGMVENQHGRGFVVLPVEESVARRHLFEALEAAALQVVLTARAARADAYEVHDLIDTLWEKR